jgi:hypothetical protein
MILETIVTNLELSLKLKEIGIKQKSMFHWVEFEKEKKIYRTVWESRELDNVLASAFTVEEIFEFLPGEFFKDEMRKFHSLIDGIVQEKEHIINHRYHLKMMPVDIADNHWYCWAIGHGYDNFGLQISETSFSEHAKTPADAAAKMLIYLIENGLLKNEES